MAKILDNNTINKAINETKSLFSEARIKDVIAKPEIQAALKKSVVTPDRVYPKKVNSPYKDKETGITTQKVEAISGTSVTNAVNLKFTLVDTELDPVKSINKPYRLVDYTFALDANMVNRQFMGYSAKGLRLMVTKLEEITETEEN